MALAALAWFAGLRLPGMALADEVSERIICAVRLSYGCRSDPQLAGPYGELASKVRENAPRIVYERGMTALPVDFRSCRAPSCSDGPQTGRVTRSLAGRPVTLFTHVVDCRNPVLAESAGLRLLRRARRARLHPVLGVLRRLRHVARPARRPRVSTPTTGRVRRSASTRMAASTLAPAPTTATTARTRPPSTGPRMPRESCPGRRRSGTRLSRWACATPVGGLAPTGRSSSPAEATPVMRPRPRCGASSPVSWRA